MIWLNQRNINLIAWWYNNKALLHAICRVDNSIALILTHIENELLWLNQNKMIIDNIACQNIFIALIYQSSHFAPHNFLLDGNSKTTGDMSRWNTHETSILRVQKSFSCELSEQWQQESLLCFTRPDLRIATLFSSPNHSW